MTVILARLMTAAQADRLVLTFYAALTAGVFLFLAMLLTN
jgi:hypothetical protein